MKYLKRFNEELKKSTYTRAANKLFKMGADRRASRLVKHSLKENGILNIEMNNYTDKYYFEVYNNFDISLDDYVYQEEDGNKNITFNLIFKIDFTIINDNYKEIAGKGMDIYNDVITDPFTVISLPIKLDDDDSVVKYGNIHFDDFKTVDKRSANIIRKHLIRCVEEERDYLNEKFVEGENLGIDYAFDVDDLINYIKTYNTNKLYLQYHK
jgi:hypothetical protein